MAKIAYNDKVQLNENSTVPSENKCMAVDMNEIKSVVNTNYDEFTTATEDSGWLDIPITNSNATPQSGVGAKYRKVGNIVYLKGAFSSANSLTTSSGSVNVSIGTMPEGYRPTSETQVIGYNVGSGACRFQVLDSGTFRLNHLVTALSSNVLTFAGWYFVD